MKKNLLSILLIIVLALSLAACGGEKAEAPVPPKAEGSELSAAHTPEPGAAPQESSEAAAPEAENPAPEAAEPEFKYGNAHFAEYYEPWLSELRASLPELPEIDIYSWEYVCPNYYNSVPTAVPESIGSIGRQGIDIRIKDSAVSFVNAISDAGYEVYLAAGYRDQVFNKAQYERHLETEGSAEAAAKVYLPPTTNDHQTGLAIDLTADYRYEGYFGAFNNDAFLETDTYKAAKEICADYGFIERYPQGKEEFYGYPCYAAGHFRYVGVDAAKFIMENNLCLEEFVALYDPSLVRIPSKLPY